MSKLATGMNEDIERIRRVVKKNKLSQVQKAKRNANYQRVRRAQDMDKGIKDLTISVPLVKHGEIREIAHKMCDEHNAS